MLQGRGPPRFQPVEGLHSQAMVPLDFLLLGVTGRPYDLNYL